MKVLVVEDQPIELKLVRHVLSDAGFTVTGAKASQEGFDVIEADPPELILIDLYLPGMDGLSMARRLKSDSKMSGIWIVATTSFPERFSRAAAFEAGFDAYFLKPLSTRTLAQQLREVAKGARRSE